MKILKFGGSSVGSPARIQSVIKITEPYFKGEMAIVFSAFGGVTDRLILLANLAWKADIAYKNVLLELEQRHMQAVRELIGIKRQTSILARVKVIFNELEDVLQGVFLVKECTPRTLDYIMSFGERISAYIITQVYLDQGFPVDFLDARKVVTTNDHFGNAKVDFTTTNRKILDHFKDNQKVQIITGFIGMSESGETTTLGRSGSDYTAAIFSGALKASSLEIWTDVDGLMTADPRLVKKAFTVPELNYEEAMELSHFGAKVIFPATMRPAMVNNIPIWIKNTFNPEFPGTCIHAGAKNGKMIKGISSLNHVSLLNLQGSGLLGVVGASMRLFSALAKENINVVLISQASSEHSICLGVDQSQSARAKAAIEREFAYEMKDEEIDEVHVEDDLSIIAVVGEGMKHAPGTSGRLFNALGKNGVNVMAIAQGSSERNISAVIRQADAPKALQALHEAFFLSDRKVLHVFLVGTGLIGKTLMEMMRDQFAHLATENSLEIQLKGIANSRKMLFRETPLEGVSAVQEMIDEGDTMNMSSYVQRMISMNLPNSIFVDCTSSDEVASYYDAILSASISIVTPNKKACSAPYASYKQLKKSAFQRGVKFLYETNVGAGLPVINTLNDLLLSGDKVIRIEAVLSGTLNYIFTSFSEGMRFSDIVKEAKSKGYTEPDPRDDLNGQDVARKILILSREVGLPLELEDIEVESLVPESCREVAGIDAFFNALAAHDQSFECLRKKSADQGHALRYMAVLADNKATAKLGSVPPEHPFYNLKGSDNIILLSTERYHDRPMVIRGPGAGAGVTAAGVFADIIRIGHYAK